MRLRSPFGYILSLAIVLSFLIDPNQCEARFDANLKSQIEQINSAIYNEQFEQAENLIDSLIPQNDSLPFAHLYKAILAQTRMMAAESDWLEAELFLALDSVEYYSQQVLTSGGDSACAYYFLGQAYAFRSLYDGRAGHLWSAVKKGRLAGQAFTDGYKIDTTFYDISLGLGSYWYWKSDKTKLINWTPLFKNEKKKGIEHLLRAADSSELSQDAARSALIWVYINEKRFDEAIRLADQLYQKYPDGLTYLWGLGQVYYKKGDYRTAATYYAKIWDRLTDDPGNYYNIIEVGWYLTDCYRVLSKSDPEARGQSLEIREFIKKSPIPKKIRRKQRRKIRYILKY